MTCRESAAGSIATAYIGPVYGLHDSQRTSLMHEERRRARQEGRTCTVEEYQSALDRMAARVETDSRFTPAVRARQRARIAAAQAHPGVMDDNTTALTTIAERARRAEQAIDVRMAEAASSRGVAFDRVRDRYAAALRTYDHREHLQEAQGYPEPPADAPRDNATRWALGVIADRSRCIDCGQFMASGGEHVCPPRAPRTPRPRRQPVTFPQPLEPSTIGPAAPEPATTDIPDGPRAAWDPDNFQDYYDQARERIDAGDTVVPTNMELEQIPGGVTGGLGAKRGGNSFGLEMEIDFPNDRRDAFGNYPMREEFARRLHEEGIVSHPQVMRWHYRRNDGQPYSAEAYAVDADNWICEYDRSVDDVGGMRGVEIKSQILYDEPKTWQNLRRILEISEELGGEATPRTGLHVNVGAQEFSTTDPSQALSLLRTAAAYDDVLIRLGNNPAAGSSEHRGRSYCTPLQEQDFNYVIRNVQQGRPTEAMHRNIFNLSHLSPESRSRQRRDSRIEGRGFDGVAKSADLGRIQAAVTLHLAIAKAAAQRKEPGQDAQPAGYNRTRFRRRRLTGAQWEESTRPVRNLVSLVEETTPSTRHSSQSRDLFRNQIADLFTRSRWSRG